MSFDEEYVGLRQHAIEVKPEHIGFNPETEGWKVYGVVMETNYNGDIVTFISLADGSTSIYFSSGGGIIGLGEDEFTHMLSERLLGVANREYKKITPSDGISYPEVGNTAISLMTASGVLSVEDKEEEFGEGRHSFSNVFHCCHDIISHARELEEDE